MEITYEVSVIEDLHPDPKVDQRFIEIGVGNCTQGCKVFADPLSDVKVLAHNRLYGCRKFYTEDMIKLTGKAK